MHEGAEDLTTRAVGSERHRGGRTSVIKPIQMSLGKERQRVTFGFTVRQLKLWDVMLAS